MGEAVTDPHVVGAQTEYVFFKALQAFSPSDPPWFLGVRRADRQEDHAGIDAFVTLDVGEVPVQIKSSLAGFDKFLTTHPGTEILIIVIGRDLTPGQIRKKIFDFLFRERGRILRKQRKKNRARH